MSYLLALLGLAVAIAVHEFGHWLSARLLGMSIQEVSLGIGPRLYSRVRKGTEYVVRALPLGAKVQVRGIHGEPGNRGPGPALRRLIVIAAGPAANFLFALGMLGFLYIAGTHVPVPRTIGQVFPGSEAARKKLLPGDEVQTLNGGPLRSWSTFIEAVADHPGEELALGVLRDGTTLSITVVPLADPNGIGHLGVAQRYSFQKHGPIEASWRAVSHLGRLAVEEVHLFSRLLLGKPGAALVERATFVRETSAQASSAPDSFIRLLSALSLALGMLHLLPFPSLDGGRATFLALGLGESRTSRRVEAALHAVGLLILTGLLVWLLVADVAILLRR